MVRCVCWLFKCFKIIIIIIYLTVPPRPPKRQPQWDIVEVPTWTDRSAIDSSRVIVGKRQRKSVVAFK